MRRRELIALAAGAAVSRPLVAPAQASKVPTIGILVVGSPGSERFWRLFREELGELHYVEGQTIRFEFRSDEGKASRLPALAAELVQLKVDVIVTWFTPAATAAKQATREIPIVMAAAGDPVATGLVDSLARPGGNITGIAAMSPELAAKSVEFLREMLPSMHRVVALVNAPDPFSRPFLEQLHTSSEATGLPINPILLHGTEELETTFTELEKDRPDALIVQPSLPIKRVAELALTHRIPSASGYRAFAEEGGLMSYWFQEAAMYRQAAVLLDKVLQGAKPADLPVQQPTKFELVINLKTARALGLTVPPLLLVRADEFIEGQAGE